MADAWRILVVEGDEILNQNMVNFLHTDGYVVQGVLNGADAVRVLWSEEYDVVLCDLSSPGAEGFELLQWLRAYRPDTRTILLGDEAPSIRMQALENGAASYLEKPLDFRHLKEELRRLLQETGFSANLDSIDLLDVVQMLNMSHRSITLLVNAGLEEQGMLRFQNGELTWAEYGTLHGEEAFFALAAHKNGSVTQQPWHEPVPPNVKQPLSRLILQALQYRTKYAHPQPSNEDQDKDRFVPLTSEDDSPFPVLTEYPSSQASQLPPVHDDQEEVTISLEAAVHRSHNPKEWWQKTDNLPTLDDKPESNLPALDNEDASIAPTIVFDEQSPADEKPEATSSTSHQATTRLPSELPLPSWLIDNPIADNMPALYPSPLKNPTMRIPTTPMLSPSSPEWLVQNTPTNNMAEQPASKRPTASQLAFPPNSGNQQPVPPEWLTAAPEVHFNGQSSPENWRSRTPTKGLGPGDFLPFNGIQEIHQSGLPPQGSPQLTRQGYNYPALISALQTLGYAITGFIAAAVVNMEGQPIAQVAVNDVDISHMCQPFSAILQSVLQSLDQKVWDNYEDMVITGTDSRILIRLVSTGKAAFQVLVTTREADPAQCLKIMADVESAIETALH